MYLENGVIAYRYQYSHLTKQYGEIVSTSANGLNFIFQKKKKHDANVFKLDLTSGLEFVKKIEIYQLFKDNN